MIGKQSGNNHQFITPKIGRKSIVNTENKKLTHEIRRIEPDSSSDSIPEIHKKFKSKSKKKRSTKNVSYHNRRSPGKISNTLYINVSNKQANDLINSLKAQQINNLNININIQQINSQPSDRTSGDAVVKQAEKLIMKDNDTVYDSPVMNRRTLQNSVYSNSPSRGWRMLSNVVNAVSSFRRIDTKKLENEDDLHQDLNDFKERYANSIEKQKQYRASIMSRKSNLVRLSTMNNIFQPDFIKDELKESIVNIILE